MYIQYQKVLHPDKFSLREDLQENSTLVSSYASNALQTLQDQIENILYLLKTEANIIALGEDDSSVPHEILMDVFAIREDIEESEIEEHLDPILMDIQTRYNDSYEIIR